MKIYRVLQEIYTSNCYIIETFEKNAIVIDPNNIDDIKKVILENNLNLRYIILSHEHYDHVCATNQIKSHFDDISIISSRVCSENLKFVDSRKKNFYLYLHFMGNCNDVYLPDCKLEKSDIEFEDEYLLNLDDCRFYLKYTPGHSPGSVIIILNDLYIFSGDSILYEKDVIVKLSGGNKKVFDEYSKKYFKSLSRNLIVMPGHGKEFLLGEKLDKDWKD